MKSILRYIALSVGIFTLCPTVQAQPKNTAKKVCGVAIIPSRPKTASKDLVKVPLSATAKQNGLALVIGVNGYRKAQPLTACVNDANAIRDLLVGPLGFLPNSVITMTDDQKDERLRPTYLEMLDTITRFLALVDEDSEVVLYFSGHGIRGEDGVDYLAPLDALPSFPERSCISFDWIRKTLEEKNPRRVLLITDACRNRLGGKALDTSPSFKGDFSDEAQFAELRSCRPNEKSQEMVDGSLSVFTHFLVEGMKGKGREADSPNVTFDSLRRYVARQTKLYVANLPGADTPQNPEGRASTSDMLLSRDAVKISDLPALPTSEPPVVKPPLQMPATSSKFSGGIAGEPTARKHALVIGAADYESLPRLYMPASDARQFASFLRDEWKFSANSITMLDGATPATRATRENILSAARTLQDKLKPGDSVVFYYSGFGQNFKGADLIIPVDASSGKTEFSGITLSELTGDLRAANVRYSLLITDASFEYANKVLASLKLPAQLKSNPDNPNQIVWLQSNQPGQTAQETEKLGGVFTHFILRGLRGDGFDAQGNLTVKSLNNYVKHSLTGFITQQNLRDQTPQALGDDFLLARRAVK